MNLNILVIVAIRLDLGEVDADVNGAASAPAEPGIIPVAVKTPPTQGASDAEPPTLREGHFPRTLRGLGFDEEGPHGLR